MPLSAALFEKFFCCGLRFLRQNLFAGSRLCFLAVPLTQFVHRFERVNGLAVYRDGEMEVGAVRRFNRDCVECADMVELLDLVSRFRQILVRKSAVSCNEPLAVVDFDHVAPKRVGVDLCHAPVLYCDNIVALCAAEVDAVVNPPVVRRLVFTISSAL